MIAFLALAGCSSVASDQGKDCKSIGVDGFEPTPGCLLDQ
jgi:hypothetical protein